MDVDPHLITALVERWRPETHTFHLPCGEATVTLQDVAIIWGLPVRGRPVITVDFGRSKEDWVQYCQQFLGFSPQVIDFRGTSRLLLTAIRRHFQGIIITDDTDLMIVDQYLRLLEDFDKARKCSWASASLATLYRELCTASSADKCVIGGPCLLLQIWAWSRITTVVPHRVRSRVPLGRLFVDDDDVDAWPLPPYGARWMQFCTFTHTASHSVRIIRDMLDQLLPYQVYIHF
ncbi:serine/threonine-protein phosphatase 7 long form homolog [Phtheirospermum japonicum]|uniref:Serine/threonine-protein phosphatase 7 long form homolog n=1 Tax=Phtheirospermum japonicum TaxID=374723 RepID=A0A830CZD0_9LAMI|nr:serine/threonine-protein phosphatase 7 long form homolog [Phtheirospermum japonicum]